MAPQKKISSFRQSGWRNSATGDFHIFYGDQMPAIQDGVIFTKVWDIMVETVTTTTHLEQPLVDHTTGQSIQTV